VIVCDEWATPAKNARFYFSGGIRLDSSLLGVALHTQDTVGALTENGTLTVWTGGVSSAKKKIKPTEEKNSNNIRRLKT